jgi:hypothetical protein
MRAVFWFDCAPVRRIGRIDIAIICRTAQRGVPAGGEKMQLEANQISRDWTILHKGRTFYVNYTDSDGHTLALMNRSNWEVLEERDDDTEELNVYVFNASTRKERKLAAKNALLKEELVKFCIENWENSFIQQIKKEMAEVLARP